MGKGQAARHPPAAERHPIRRGIAGRQRRFQAQRWLGGEAVLRGRQIEACRQPQDRRIGIGRRGGGEVAEFAVGQAQLAYFHQSSGTAGAGHLFQIIPVSRDEIGLSPIQTLVHAQRAAGEQAIEAGDRGGGLAQPSLAVGFIAGQAPTAAGPEGSSGAGIVAAHFHQIKGFGGIAPAAQPEGSQAGAPRPV